MKNLLLPASLLCCSASLTFGTWNWSDPQPQGNALAAAANSSDGAMVAVGAYSAGLRRAPGDERWSSTGPIAGADDLTSVTYHLGQFYAVGPRAGLWTSDDNGATWTAADKNQRGRHVFSMGNRLVVLDGSTSRVSVEGGAFQVRELDASYRTAGGNGHRVVVAGSGGLVASSNDGENWSRSTVGGADHIFYVIGSGAQGFLLGGVRPSADGLSFVPVLFESADGQNWSQAGAPAGTAMVYQILGVPGGWIFQNSGDGRLFRRNDSGEWSALTGEGLENFAVTAAVSPSLLSEETFLFDGRGLIAQLDAGSDSVMLTPSLRPTGLLYEPSFALAAAGDLALAVDRNVPNPSQNVLLRTLDGVSWTEVPSPPVTSLTALTAAGGVITGFSSGDRATGAGFYRTSDGVAWEKLPRSARVEPDGDVFAGPVVSLAARDAAGAAVALTRRESYDRAGRYRAERGLFFSPNWVDWAPVALPELRDDPPPLPEVSESVQWDGRRFILLIHPGRIFVSPDGLVWSLLPALPEDSPAAPPLPAQNLAVAVASDGGDLLVARAAKLNVEGNAYDARFTGTPELFYVFRDGRWWRQPVGQESPPDLRRIIWDGHQFVATARREILTSRDGLAWHSHPAPTWLAALVWSGSRLFGFGDSFGILYHEGRLAGGQRVPEFLLSPPSFAAESRGGNYRISLQMPEDTAWSIRGLPAWMKISPVTGIGPAELDVSVLPNPSKKPRGAVLQVGNLTHYLHQAGEVDPLPLTASWSGSFLTVPFSGAWHLAGDPLLLIADRTSGQGPVRFRLPANQTATPRTIVFNLNGVSYTIRQDAAPPALSRGGVYEGLVGSLPPGQDADPCNLETFEGFVRFKVTRPRGSAAHGAYSARLVVHRDGRNLVFSGRGALDAEGRVIHARWTVRGRGKAQAIEVDFEVGNDGPYGRQLGGSFAFADRPGDTYHFVAGKSVFESRRAPLPSQYAGRATIFLGEFGVSSSEGRVGVGAVRLASSGAARMMLTLTTGAKVTSAATVWGGAGPDLILPFGLTPGRGGRSFLGGYLVADRTRNDFDWEGFGGWSNFPADETTFLSTEMSRYTPPPFDWSSDEFPAQLSYVAAGESLTGKVRLGPRGRLVVELDDQDGGTPRVSLRLNPSNGLVKGAVKQGGKLRARLFGAVNAKGFSLGGNRGAVLGVVPGSAFGQFSIVPGN